MRALLARIERLERGGTRDGGSAGRWAGRQATTIMRGRRGRPAWMARRAQQAIGQRRRGRAGPAGG